MPQDHLHENLVNLNNPNIFKTMVKINVSTINIELTFSTYQKF